MKPIDLAFFFVTTFHPHVTPYTTFTLTSTNIGSEVHWINWLVAIGFISVPIVIVLGMEISIKLDKPLKRHNLVNAAMVGEKGSCDYKAKVC